MLRSPPYTRSTTTGGTFIVDLSPQYASRSMDLGPIGHLSESVLLALALKVGCSAIIQGRDGKGASGVL